jgi:hypothetical protein
MATPLDSASNLPADSAEEPFISPQIAKPQYLKCHNAAQRCLSGSESDKSLCGHVRISGVVQMSAPCGFALLA